MWMKFEQKINLKCIKHDSIDRLTEMINFLNAFFTFQGWDIHKVKQTY